MKKLRWINGWGDEGGTQHEYSFYLEDKETKEKQYINTAKVTAFLKANHLTTKDFRGYKEKALTYQLIKYLEEA